LYTFPKIIKSLADILSSDEEEEAKERQSKSNREVLDVKAFKKKLKTVKQVDTSRQYDSSEQNPFQSNKKGKDKLKTNDSTGKPFKEEMNKVKVDMGSNSKKGKKRTERLKTEQDSQSHLETLRVKV
jgi:hypothetical protein